MKTIDSSLSFAVAALILIFSIFGAQSIRFNFGNKCGFPVWPATLANANTTQFPNNPQLPNTGFKLDQGATVPIDAPTAWSGRFWARTGCTTDTSGKFTCETGECGSGQVPCNGKSGVPPATLVEVTLNGNNDNSDTYDISLVDGFNLPLNVVPSQGSCPTSSCTGDINSACPAILQSKGPNGKVIGCKSACVVCNKPKYCCRPADNPAACPTTDYANFFKGKCPQAYSYAKDDNSSTCHCPSGADYAITFCP